MVFDHTFTGLFKGWGIVLIAHDNIINRYFLFMVWMCLLGIFNNINISTL